MAPSIGEMPLDATSLGECPIDSTGLINADNGKITSDGNGNLTAVSFVGSIDGGDSTGN